MSQIAVTGAAGPVGRRVVARLLADADVERVVAIDREAVVSGHDSDAAAVDPRLRTHRVQLRTAPLDELFAGVDVICHLAGSDPLEGTSSDHDLHATARVLAAAATVGIEHLVVRTSATVYGAWPDNPVPLTENAPTRPNPESEWVRVRAALEERVLAFAERNPDVGVAILRPCITVSPSGPDELGRVLSAARLVASGEDEPPAQFVHADDVAAAIDLVRRERGEGIYNVAPDGALDAELIRALVGGAPRMRLPGPLARGLAAFGWRYQLAPTPPGFVPFVNHPWVVANDRLRSLGWAPAHTNEEAFVIAHAAAPWASISPQRRQEIALGLAVTGLLGAAGGVAAVVRRRLRG